MANIGEVPFIGRPLPLGGTTEDVKLLEFLPQELRGSDWQTAAMMLYYKGATNLDQWSFLDEDNEIIDAKMGLLRGVLGSVYVDFHDMLAIGGWMLSETVESVPVIE